MAIATVFVINLITNIVLVFINALALWLTEDRILRHELYIPKGFTTALAIAAIAGLVNFGLGLLLLVMPPFVAVIMLIIALVINAIVLFFLIRNFYEVSWLKTVVAWLIVTIVSMVISFFLGGIVGLFL